MFVHTVFFWFEGTPADADVEAFEEGLASLLAISTARGGWYGPPAGTPRDVVDNSYAYGLTVLFDDASGHDTYQECPGHLAFIARHKHLWARVQVYDYMATG